MSDQTGLTNTETESATVRSRRRIELGTLAHVELEPKPVPIHKDRNRTKRFQLIDEQFEAGSSKLVKLQRISRHAKSPAF